MENAASIRTQSAVAAFDPTDHVAEYGFTTANAPALRLARGLCADLAKTAVDAIDRHFEEMKAIGQNPYRERCSLADQELRFVAVVEVFPDGTIAGRFDRTFSESPDLPRPKLPKLMRKLVSEIDVAVRAFGFELAACEHRDDGTLARVAVRDPIYAAEALNVRGPALPMNDLDAGLQRLRSSAGATAKADLGVRSLKSAETLQSVVAFVDDIATRAVETTRAYLEAMISAEVSPFTTTSGWVGSQSAFVVDPSRVFRYSDGDIRTERSATVIIERVDAIMNRFRSAFGDDVTVRDETFLKYVTTAVGQRLEQHPELRPALVALRNGSFNGVEAVALTVFCVDDPAPSQATGKRAGLLRRLLDRLLMRSPTPALPAPTSPALPAPEAQASPEVIPPVALPSQQQTSA